MKEKRNDFFELKVNRIHQETDDCQTIEFEIPEELKEEFSYLPGQYLTFKFDLDGKELRRSYSLCSAQSDNIWRVAIKKVEDGRFSNYIHNNLKEGDTLSVMSPRGNFTPKYDAENNHLLAFAAGSGITPILSIIKNTLEKKENAKFTLVYGNKRRNSIIFKEELEALKNKYMDRFTMHHIFSREQTDTPLFYGRINKEKVQTITSKLIPLSSVSEVFICGPEEMIHELKDYFIDEMGWSIGKVHFELFRSPDQPQQVSKEWMERQAKIDPSKESALTIKLDGNHFEMPATYGGASILDTGIDNGLNLPFACKGGVCSTCKAKLIEGEVDMAVNYALEPDEIENNFILTCQAHPRSEKVVVDFDAK